MMSEIVRVLIVDDSALVRKMLKAGLEQDAGIKVIGEAVDAFDARKKLVECKPDVVTLDVEMPRVTGVEFLKKTMPIRPIPVVMVSSHTRRGAKVTLEALEAGAVDFVCKPTGDSADSLDKIIGVLIDKIKSAAKVDVSKWKQVTKPSIRRAETQENVTTLGKRTGKVLAIGASTGGTVAISQMLKKMPSDIPATIIVQHMPANFTRMFAERLDTQCPMRVAEAKDGDFLEQGKVLVAPGGFQAEIRKAGSRYKVKLSKGEKVCGHAPSVEVMMKSVAESAGSLSIGVILTGMGGDGAQGMLAMRQAGAKCYAQDEASSVVFGMPNVAFQVGGAEELVPLDKMHTKVLGQV